MNNAVRPKLRRQIHPAAIALLEKHDPQNLLPQDAEPNYTDEGKPLWLGPSQSFWDSITRNPEELNALIAILRSDFPTFCAIIIRIYAKRLGCIVPFFFNRGQVMFWEMISARIAAAMVLFVVILKARQFGISTFVTVWDYWHTWRLEDETAVLIGDSDQLVMDFISRIGVIHDELPDLEWFKPELRQNTKRSRVPKKQLEYVDRRTKILTMVDKQVKVGLVAKHFLLSELAKYSNPEGLIEDLMPMLPARGSSARLHCSLFVESTPRGKNYFYTLWQQAKARESEWIDFFLPWFVLEDEYSIEPPEGWKPDKELRDFWKRCTHERMKLEGLPVTIAQIYWYHCELADADFDQDKMDRQYPTDDETCFLIGNDSVFRREIRYVKQCVQDAESDVAANWLKRNIKLPNRTKPWAVWRGELIRVDVNDPAKIINVPDPYTKKNPDKFVPLFMPMLGKDGKKVTGPHANRGRLWVWSPPIPNHIYVVGVDASGGVGANDSAMFVIDACCGKQVAEFIDSECGPEYLADEACTLGYWYNTALLNPEVNSIGATTMKRLLNVWKYPKVAREEKWDEPGLKPHKYGTYMNPLLKRQLIMNLRYFLMERYFQPASDGFLSQCSTFEKQLSPSGEETYGCDPPNKDDLVMSAALACLAIRQSPRLIGYVKQRAPLPTAAQLGLNEVPGGDAPVLTIMPQSDPRRDIMDKLPQSLRDILKGNQSGEMVADPFEPIGGF